MAVVVPIRRELEQGQQRPSKRHRQPARVGPKNNSHLAFTPSRIEQLIRSGATGYRYDAKTPGLAIRLGKSKGVYVHAYRDNGAYVRRTLGNVGTISLGDARLAVAAAAGALARGATLPMPRQARRATREARAAEQKRTGFTLEVAFQAYLAGHELKPNTLKDYRSVWKHVPAALKTTPLAEVTTETLTELHRNIGRKHKRAANKVVVLIAAICKASGRHFDNPAFGIKRYRETPRSRRLSPEETTKLRAVLAAERDHDDHDRAKLGVFVTIALLTGARRSSIASMRWADLDLRKGQAVWIVPARWSKNGAELAVALTDEAAAALGTWKDRCLAVPGSNSAWVFPSQTSASGHVAEPRKGWERIRKAASITDATLHDLRRSLGSQVAAAGGNAATIAGVLGHMSLQSAKSYLHLNTVEVRRALEKLRGSDA